MRVLHSESSTGWGGQENRTLNEMIAMRERGHEMAVVSRPGARILDHTHTHTRWDNALSDTAQREIALAGNLADSRRHLETRLGVVSSHLCWPQGYYDDQYLVTAKRLGFENFYTTEPRVNRPNSSVDRIGRIVTKEKSGNWLLRRTRLYAAPWLGGIYAALRAAR